MNKRLIDSWIDFLSREWPWPSIPKRQTYWLLLQRWAWQQGPMDSAEEIEALAFARQIFHRRYGSEVAETKVGLVSPEPKPQAPKAQSVPDRRATLVFG